MDNITPPQISEERIAQLWDAMPKAWPFPSETRASRAAFAQAVAAEINRQWLERLEPVAIQAGPLKGLYRIKEQG